MIDKVAEECHISNVVAPSDTRIVKKRRKIPEKHRDLGMEIGRMWNKRANTIPVVIGALGTTSKNHLKYLGELECNISFESIQKTTLLGTVTQKCSVLISL